MGLSSGCYTIMPFGLEVEIKAPKCELEIKAPKVEIKAPKCEVEVEMEVDGVSVEIEMDAEVNADGEIEIDYGSAKVELKAPKIEIKTPKAEVEVSLGFGLGGSAEVSAEVEIPAPEVEVDVEVKAPKVKVEIEVPKVEVKLGAGFGFGGSAKVEAKAPKVEIEVPKAEVKLEADQHVTIKAPQVAAFGGPSEKTESITITAPASAVSAPGVEVEVSAEVSADSVNVEVTGGAEAGGSAEAGSSDSMLKSIFMCIAFFLGFLSWLLTIGAASVEKWMEHSDGGTSGLRWMCSAKDVCMKLLDAEYAGVNCNAQEAGNAVLGLLGFGLCFVTPGMLFNMAAFLMHSSPIWGGRLCTPKAGIKTFTKCNPFKTTHVGMLCIITALFYIVGDFWIMVAFGRYINCFEDSDGWSYSDGVGCSVTAWLFFLFSSAFLLFYAFTSKDKNIPNTDN